MGETSVHKTAQFDGAGGRGPLAGVRIVEFGAIGPVPFAGMLLADMGADIVRIERPGGWAAKSKVIDRGRRIVELDLKATESVNQVLNLIDGADALLEGFRPGVMERLGLGPDIARARNPKLVYGRMTGWGQTGPHAQAPGRDINYIAITGALAAMGPRERAPLPPLNLVGDYGGGALYLAMGVLAALLAAREIGIGQVIDCAMCDGAASLMSMFYEWGPRGEWSDRREANIIDGGAPFYGCYACADGRYLSIALMDAAIYRRFCEEFGLAEQDIQLRDDQKSWPAIRARFAAVFAQRTRAQWCEALEGGAYCFAPVLTMAEAPHHPHLVARSTFIEREGITQPAPVPRFSETPSNPRDSQREPSIAGASARWRPGR